MARHNRLCVTASLLLLVTSACGVRQNAASEPTPTTTTSQTSSASVVSGQAAVPAQESPCTADLLTGSVEALNADPGTRLVVLVVRNKSRQVCTLSGFGGLELRSATGEPIPTNAERNLKPVPTLVRLNPGGEAGKRLQWIVTATGDEPTSGPCQPSASSIEVLPPDETVPLRVDYAFGSVCDHGRIETSAYYPR